MGSFIDTIRGPRYPVIICVEGSIGAGKTTLLKMIKCGFGKNECAVLPEPLEKWRDCNGIDLFGLFYQNKGRYSHAFQHYALLTRVKQLNEILRENRYKYIFVERSHMSCVHCFAKMLHDEKDYDNAEYQVYLKEYEFLSRFTPKIDHVIYLDTSVEECMKRIEERNRKGEKSGVSMEYLTKLEGAYANWMKNAKDKYKIRVWPGNDNFHESGTDAQRKMWSRMCSFKLECDGLW
jgi:deoxynucleoside kinase